MHIVGLSIEVIHLRLSFEDDICMIQYMISHLSWNIILVFPYLNMCRLPETKYIVCSKYGFVTMETEKLCKITQSKTS